MKTIFFKTHFDKTLVFVPINGTEISDNILMGPLNDDTLQIPNSAELFGLPLGTIFVASVADSSEKVKTYEGSSFDGIDDFKVEGNEIIINKIRPFLTTTKPHENPENILFTSGDKHPVDIVNASELESWFALKVNILKEDFKKNTEEYKAAKTTLEELVDDIKSKTKFSFGTDEKDTFPTLENMITPPKIESLEELDKNAGKSGGKFSSGNIADFIKSNFPRPTVAKCGFHVDEELWILLVRNVLRRENTMIIGPTGTGKTELINLVAEGMGFNLHIQDMGTVIDASSTLQGVHRIKDGKSIFDFAPYAKYIADPKSIILLDELNRSSLASRNILFPQLDNRRYLPIDSAEEGVARKINVHEENSFFATANIGQEYSGTSEIDRALLDRFFPVEVGYLKPSMERKVLQKRVGIAAEQANAIVSVLGNLRTLASKEEISSSVSMRHGLQVAGLVKDGFPMNKALEHVILPLFTINDGGDHEVKTIKSVFASV